MSTAYDSMRCFDFFKKNCITASGNCCLGERKMSRIISILVRGLPRELEDRFEEYARTALSVFSDNTSFRYVPSTRLAIHLDAGQNYTDAQRELIGGAIKVALRELLGEDIIFRFTWV